MGSYAPLKARPRVGWPISSFDRHPLLLLFLQVHFIPLFSENVQFQKLFEFENYSD
jgi:hypothetical protein